jgi:glycosyltransferase involved in cell wall biosynthesis
MRILALAHGLLFGGAQVSTLEFLEGLKEKLDLRLLICSEADKNFASNAASIGIEVYYAPCRVSSGYPIMDMNNVKDLIEWADIAWITDEEYLSAPRIKQIRNIPVIAHIHSYALICPWWGALYGLREVCLKKCSLWRITRCKQGFKRVLLEARLLSKGEAMIRWMLDFGKGPLDYARWRLLMRNVLDSIDAFIPVSNALWNIHLKHTLDIKSKLSIVIYNLVIEPLKHVKIDPVEPRDNYVFYASGANIGKGPHLLLEAWTKVSGKFRDFKLYMIGCKNTWVERKAREMNLQNIIFTGKLPPREYYHLMYKAKAVVMPSIWPEPFGRIPVEASRLGVPAVVSSAGGLPETVVDGITGYMFKAGDADDLAEKVTKVLEKNFDRKEIIKNSYEKINPQREAEKLIKFFESIISHKG